MQKKNEISNKKRSIDYLQYSKTIVFLIKKSLFQGYSINSFALLSHELSGKGILSWYIMEQT